MLVGRATRLPGRRAAPIGHIAILQCCMLVHAGRTAGLWNHVVLYRVHVLHCGPRHNMLRARATPRPRSTLHGAITVRAGRWTTGTATHCTNGGAVV